MYTQDNGKKYTGTKTIYSWPCTRGEYNAYRGWMIPAGEDPDDEGYLVEYTDGGKPNHTNHAGYISWSPADVFERSYVEDTPTTWQGRLIAEGQDAVFRLVKLEDFLASPGYNTLDASDRQLLMLQAQCMNTYVDILARRVARFNSNAPDTLAS